MTWLSRLLPPTPSLKGRVNRQNRTAKQRRRAMTVENLEHRIVLSNVSTSITGTALTINADQFNNSFRIIESTASGPDHGKVTVESTFPSTTINGTLAPYQTTKAITSITINLLGSNSDTDDIEIVGAGQNATTTVKTITINVNKTYLKLDVHDVSNSGAFSLKTKGKLDATLTDSTFSAVTIDQSQGCCVADVELANVTATGSVKISEGKYSGTEKTHNSVYIHDSKLGSTTISQLDGDWNSVEVANTTLKDLYVSQGDGDHDSIYVHDDIKIASSGFGIDIWQGDGNDDEATVDDVNVTGLITNKPVKVPNIYIHQGDGKSDYASVSNVNIGGNVGIWQGDGADDEAYITDSYIGSVYLGTYYFGSATIVQGDGVHDQAGIEGVVANWAYITQGDGDEVHAWIFNSTVFGEAGITQGDGGDIVHKDEPDLIGNVAEIDGVTGTLYDIWIVQGNGNGDQASISNSDAQGLDHWYDSGTIYIIQGNGANNDAWISSVTVGIGNVFIQQGDGASAFASIDSASINGTGWWYDFGSIYITQGNGAGDEAYITNSTALDSIWISQGDGAADIALIDGSSTTWGNIAIYQGDGAGDTATVSNSLAAWQIIITQGDGVLDTAEVLNSSALGYSDPVYDQAGNLLYWIDYAGEIVITQGDGYGDWATVDGMYDGADYTATNVYIYQGNNIVTPDCDGFPGDTVFVNNAIIVSDLFIYQGHDVDPDGDEPAAWGGYSVYIAAGTWDRDGNVLTDPGDVVAGGYTYIYQLGGGNQVVMGSDSSAFYTTYLDIYTGDLGGGFVMATNVTVDWGSGQGNDFSIDGGDGGNVYFDAGGNSGFTASDNYSTVTL